MLRGAAQSCRFRPALLLVACLGSAEAQQQPVPRPPTIKVEVKQVLVPVVVTDRKGHNVTGLAARDFEVFEDGAPQKILSLATESEGALQAPESPAAGAKPAVSPEKPAGLQPPLRRTYVICLDTLNSAFEHFVAVRKALTKLFKQEEGSDSQYGLFALGRQNILVQDLTRDPGAVLEALDGKRLNKAILSSESSSLASEESQFSHILSEYCQGCPCAGAAAASSRTSGGSGQICSGRLEAIEMWASAQAQLRTQLTRQFLRGLLELVGMVGKAPGKRDLILVSDGFNLRPGRGLYGRLAAYTGNPSEIMKDTGDFLEPEVQDVLRMATERNVTFYTLDSRGLYTSLASGFDASGEYEMTRAMVLLPQIQQQKDTAALENQDAMAELAAATGGVFFHNSNDLFKGVRQAFVDGRESYLLAYASTNLAADGKFRKISVEVKGKNLVVRAKRGYWAPGGEETRKPAAEGGKQ